MTTDGQDGQPKQLELSTGSVELNDDGIAVWTSHRGAHETLASAKEIVAAYERLGGGRRLRIVADIRGVRVADRAARQHFSSDDMVAVASAMAVVIDSGISRIIGNFFMGLNKPRIPTRLFTSVDAGVEWAKGLPE